MRHCIVRQTCETRPAGDLDRAWALIAVSHMCSVLRQLLDVDGELPSVAIPEQSYKQDLDAAVP